MNGGTKKKDKQIFSRLDVLFKESTEGKQKQDILIAPLREEGYQLETYSKYWPT